jgi:hypothetical protein
MLLPVLRCADALLLELRGALVLIQRWFAVGMHSSFTCRHV